MEERVRLSRGSADRQTAQRHPIIGTPWDVPEPRTVTVSLDAGIPGDMGLRMPVASGISRQKREFHLVFPTRQPIFTPSMRHMAALGALCFLATSSLAPAQI